MATSPDEGHGLLLRCPRCGTLYEDPANGLYPRQITTEEASQLFPRAGRRYFPEGFGRLKRWMTDSVSTMRLASHERGDANYESARLAVTAAPFGLLARLGRPDVVVLDRAGATVAAR